MECKVALGPGCVPVTAALWLWPTGAKAWPGQGQGQSPQTEAILPLPKVIQVQVQKHVDKGVFPFLLPSSKGLKKHRR